MNSSKESVKYVQNNKRNLIETRPSSILQKHNDPCTTK